MNISCFEGYVLSRKEDCPPMQSYSICSKGVSSLTLLSELMCNGCDVPSVSHDVCSNILEPLMRTRVYT